MDFEFGKKAEQLRADIREFVKEELGEGYYAPLFNEEHFDNHWEKGMEIARKLAQRGWLTMAWPEAYGGSGASFWEQVVFKEEVGYWGIPGTGMGVSGTQWIGPSLMVFGTEEQKKKYLPPIAAGQDDGVWCTGYSEPDAGSDLASLQTSARQDGDDYIINGQKVWNSAGHRARWCWLACRTDPDAPKHKGISIIIVDMQSEGVTVRPIHNIVGQNYFNEIFFKEVRVPKENLVDRENNGWAVLMRALSFERGIGIEFGARMQRVLDELVAYAKDRGLLENAVIRRKLADLFIDLRGMRLNAYETAWKESQGKTVIYEPARDKACLDELMEKFSYLGTEILGAYAQVDPLQEACRWARLNSAVENIFWVAPGISIAAGTTDTMRNIVARFGLNLPKTY